MEKYHGRLPRKLTKKEQLTGSKEHGVSQVALVVKNQPANARDISDVGSIPRFGRFPGGGNGNPLQYFCLKNPHRIHRGAWQATVHRDAKGRTRLKRLSMHKEHTEFSCLN